MCQRRNGRQGQSAIEFLAMLVLLMIVFAGFYSVIGEQRVSMLEQQVSLKAEAVADRMAFELDLALTAGEGFNRTVTFPEKIGGSSYTVDTVGGTMEVSWAERSLVTQTAAETVFGSLAPGENRFINNGTGVKVVQP